MKGNIKLAFTLLLVALTNLLPAQNSQVMYYMNIPQRHLLNPALRPTNKVYIGLPVISGINFNVNNNFFNFSDVFLKGRADSVITFLHPSLNPDEFLSKVRNKNFIEPEATVQLFGLGFSFGDHNNYLFFDVNERLQGNIVIPGDLFRLAIKGNEAFAGDEIDLSSLRWDMKYYREVGLTFSRDFSDKLRIGVKGKLLFGIAAASIDNRSLGISVSNDYTHTFDADVSVNISAPLKVIMDSNKNFKDLEGIPMNGPGDVVGFLMGKGNKGLGVDFGATYKFSERIMLSAALSDVGFIKWKKNVSNIKTDSRFVFNGFDMTDVLKGTKTFDEVGQNILDSLKNSFKLTNSKEPFTTFLPFGVTLGGSYSLTPKVTLGVLSYSRFIGKQMREALTLSANVNLGNALSTSLSYTATNHRWNNLGAGLSLRAGFFQFYLLTDRIPLSFNRITDNKGQGFILPSSFNNFNFRLGMNLVFGNRIKKDPME